MFTTQDLAAVNAAIASGELTVRGADGRQITYRSMAELERARGIIEADLAKQAQPGGSAIRQFRFTTLRGF